MYRIFCCRTRHSSRVEVDEVTDSLEKCLAVERGIREFRMFLETNHFAEESITLSFALKCQSILTEIARVSPQTRALGLPPKIEHDISKLYEMANSINFDLTQMDSLRNLFSADIEKKSQAITVCVCPLMMPLAIIKGEMSGISSFNRMSTLQMARSWAIDLLQEIYKTFRRRALAAL